MYFAANRIFNSAITSRAGAISGIAEDTDGGAIPGASITITNQATALTRTVTTTDAGQFSFPVLPPDIYVVTVEKRFF